MKRKRVVYVTMIAIVFMVGFIGFRIYNNMNNAKLKAAAMTRGRVLTVEVMPVFRKDITPVLTFTASLEPIWHSDISPKVDGRIESLFTDEAQRVTAGQIVAKLENIDFSAQVSQAEGTMYSVSADLAQAKSDLARNKMLVEKGALSQQQYDASIAKVASLEGQLRASKGNLGYQQSRLGFTEVVTPHAGTVMTRYLQSGDYAKAGTPIFTIADTSVMLAKATVGEGQITQVKVGDTAQVLVDSLSDQPLIGKITKILPAAAVPARTFTLEVSLSNSDNRLLSGLTAKVMAKGTEHSNAIVVPEDALVLFEDQQTVFVLSNDQVVQRKLRLGYIGNGWAEVLSGLNPGELIVVKGQSTIRDGSRVQVAATRKAGQI